MQSKFGIIFFLLITLCIGLQAASINGKVDIDDSWEPVIYLSLINSFNDLNTASYDFLIQEADIDSSGYFEITGLVLPGDDRIYRLHICKKGDPISTIMIGGKDENFIHLIINNNSYITVITDPENSGFQYCRAEGHPANPTLQILFGLQKELFTPPSLPSKQNREIIQKQIINKYKIIADTASQSIIKLFALHLLSNSFDFRDMVLMENIKSELKQSDSSSPYYLAFTDQLEYLKYKAGQSKFKNLWWLKWAGLVALIVLIGLVFRMRTRPKGKIKINQQAELVQTLSVQEKKVFELIRSGASNKEISIELNIEVSTVKSHVHKIFSRLGVKSRKEIVNKEW